MGIEFEITGPEDSAKWVKDESDRIGKLMKDAKIKMN